MLPGPAGGERRRSPWHPGGPAWVRAANAPAGRIGTASGEVRVGTGGTRRPRKRGAVIAKRSRVLLVAVVLGGTDVAVCLGTGRVRVWLSFSFSCFWSVAGLRFSSGRNKQTKKSGQKSQKKSWPARCGLCRCAVRQARLRPPYLEPGAQRSPVAGLWGSSARCAAAQLPLSLLFPRRRGVWAHGNYCTFPTYSISFALMQRVKYFFFSELCGVCNATGDYSRGSERAVPLRSPR